MVGGVRDSEGQLQKAVNTWASWSDVVHHQQNHAIDSPQHMPQWRRLLSLPVCGENDD